MKREKEGRKKDADIKQDEGNCQVNDGMGMQKWEND
jgi:hypothetical protein